MNTVNKILIMVLLCLLSNSTYSQIYQYSKDGKEACIDCESKNSLLDGNICVCFTQSDMDRANLILGRLEHERREKWLREQEVAIQKEMENRLNVSAGHYGSYEGTQRAFFRSFMGGENTRHVIEEAQKHNNSLINKTTKSRTKNSYEKATLRVALDAITSGTTYDFGDLTATNPYTSKPMFIKDMNAWTVNDRLKQTNSFETGNSNLASLRSKIKDGLDKLKNNPTVLEDHVVNEYMNHYNDNGHLDKVKLMIKYMIWDNWSKGNIVNTFPFRQDHFPPAVLDYQLPRYQSATLNIAENIGVAGAIPTIPNVSGDTAVLNYAYAQMGDNVYDFINKPDNAEIKLESNNYIKYHTFSQESMDLYKDVIESFADKAKNFPFNKYDFSLDNGSLFTMDFHNENYQTRLVNFHHHNGGRTRKYHGLPNILRQLRFETTTKQQRAFIGGFYLDMVKDNGYDLSSYITAENAFSQFKFRVFDINNLGRYDIEILYTGDTGFMVSRDRIFFPQFLQGDELTKEAVKSFFSFDYEKYWHLVRVRDLRDEFNLTQGQVDLFKDNSSITSNLTKFIEDKENSKVKPLINAITQFGIENNSSSISVQMINDLLTSLNTNTVFDVGSYLNPNAIPNIEGSIVTCCEEPWNPSPDPELILAFGADLFHAGSDALKSMLLASYEFWVTDKFEGRFVRKVFKMKGIDVPSDITDEVLGDLYSIRYDNSEFAILHEIGLGQNFIDLGFNLLDVVTIISPSKGGGAYLAINGGGKITKAALKAHLNKLKQIAETTLAGGRGHKSYRAFQKAEGNASPGNELHHIVERGGFQSKNEIKFGKTNIHNTKNIIDIPGVEAGSLHKRVTGHYNSKPNFTQGKTVREWLADKSFQFQYDYGIKILKENGWDGVTGIID
ncbi:hypothetical protein ABW636_14190 [Aquimarina sp. 2201CG1-2-11]|uniref:hypothetical protein n=1 Tax=Aquimarina discodermiae TaxID=3231043 RepID=UPI0034638065